MTDKRSETWGLTKSDVDLWLSYEHLGQRIRVDRGNFLYEQGEISSFFYIILAGEIRISIFEEDGKEVIIEVMGPWALCGEAPAFDELPRFTSAVAVRDAEVLRFDARKLAPAFKENPDLALSLLRITSIKQRVLAVRLEYAFAYSPEDQIVHTIRRIGDLFGSTTKDGRKLDVRLTHEQIANMTGTSRVTVTRVLNRLKQQKVIEVRKGQIVFLKRLQDFTAQGILNS